MVKKIDEIELDLDKDILLGWDRWKQIDKVGRYIQRNFEERAPGVDVVRAGKAYQLFRDIFSGSENIPSQYGGHNRSISNYISGHKLRVNLYESHRKGVEFIIPAPIFFPVQKISFLGEGNYEFLSFLEDAPPDVFLKFIKRCHFNNSFSQKLRNSKKIRAKYNLTREHFLDGRM